METRSGVFAVAITVLLLMALTMNSVSAESKAKVKLGPSDVAKEKLNHSNAAKVALKPSESMTFPTDRALNELIYDDGTAENAYVWSLGDNGFAVQFTPLSYPVDLRTARICFWSDWPDPNHEEFAVYVYDDDGPSGEPGTCLGGPIFHTATAWGWCDVDLSGLGITIENGDFYILYKQRTDSPDCEALCVDQSLPRYGRSWDYVGGSWDLWNENYIIRCVVDDDVTDEWTYMVYLDGDNNLEGAGIDDFMEMSSVGSTSGVNIVVQFDRIPGYVSSYDDWTDCKRFHVTSGMTPTAANAISDLGECNMGDPNTLRDFVDWAMANFPADNYALILWNHGSGWKSINNWVPWADDLRDAKDAGSSRGICWDNTNKDHLSLQETEVALTGKYVQLLGYDACLMHMVEVVYQVMANAAVSVGSEESEPGDGWPYDTILADLTGTPTMNEDALATIIVDRYMASYPTYNDLTQSAMDNNALPNLVVAVDNLAQALINEINGGHWTQVQQARSETEEIYYNYYIDLYHFAQKIQTYVPGAAAQAQAVMNEVSSSMYEVHGSSVPNDHGLSIYYPRVESDYLPSYDNTAFASDTQWDEFLKRYYNVPEPILCTDPDPPSHGFGSVPEGQTRDWSFDITNCGEGTLTWTVSDDQSWITVNPPSDSTTTETDAVTVSIDTTGLGSGITHTGTVTVSSNDGTKQGLISVYVPEPGTPIAYLKKGPYGATDYDLYIYTAPTTIGEHGTLIATDYWSPDGDTRAVATIDINGDGVDEIAYLKKGPYGAYDYDLYIYTAPTAIGEHGTLIATDYWSPDGDTRAITAVGGGNKIAYLKKGPYGDPDYDLYIYTAPTFIGEHGTLLATDYWSPDGDTRAITAVGGGDKIAYLKKGPHAETDYDLYFYTAPTFVGEHGTLLATDYWSPDGDTRAVATIDIGDGDEIAYLKKGPYGAVDYDLYIYTAQAHGTLTASDKWSPDGQTKGISALW